jgi:hypothetical protein
MFPNILIKQGNLANENLIVYHVSGSFVNLKTPAALAGAFNAALPITAL